MQDEDGNIIVIEMQVADRQNLPYRLRYYQEQIDHGLLLPGKDYRDLMIFSRPYRGWELIVNLSFN